MGPASGAPASAPTVASTPEPCPESGAALEDGGGPPASDLDGATPDGDEDVQAPKHAPPKRTAVSRLVWRRFPMTASSGENDELAVGDVDDGVRVVDRDAVETPVTGGWHAGGGVRSNAAMSPA